MKEINIKINQFLNKNSINAIKYLVNLITTSTKGFEKENAFFLAYESIQSYEIAPKFNFLTKHGVEKAFPASCFKNNTWELYPLEVNPLCEVHNYRIRWIDLGKNIPPAILFKLKLIAAYTITDKSLLNSSNTRMKVKSFNTLVTKIENIIIFFNSVFKNLEKKHNSLFVKQYCELSDVSLDVLNATAQNEYWNVDAIKSGIAIFDNIQIWKKIGEQKPKQITWSKLPLKSIKKDPNYKSRPVKQKYFDSLDFKKLTEIATYHVIDFLNSVNEDPKCKFSAAQFHDALNRNRFKSEEYPENLIKIVGFKINFPQRSRDNESGIDSQISHPLFKELKIDKILKDEREINSSYSLPTQFKQYGNTASIRKYLVDVQTSALFLLGSYTPMRPSEFRSIDFKNCLTSKEVGLKDRKMSFIKSTSIKGKERTGLFNEEFIAINILEDAVKVVNKLNEFIGYQGIFGTKIHHTTRTIHNETTLKTVFQSFINKNLGDFKYHFYPYFFRHNFAYQLYREDLSLVHISFAMKHIVHGMARYKKSSSTTLGYGETGDLIAGKNSTAQELRKAAGMEKIRNQFDPNGSFSGPAGAKHKGHLARVFKAYVDEGLTNDEVLELMYEQGYSLINMGIAYCEGLDVNEEHTGLPCVGGVDCSIKCQHAIISSEHIPRIEELRTQAISIQSNARKMKVHVPDYKQYQIDKVIEITTFALNNFDIERY